MNALNKISTEWIPLQIKVFSRWVSSHLVGNNVRTVTDITTDFLDGVALVQLAESLTRKPAPRKWNPNPTKSFHYVENNNLAVDMFAKDGVRLVNISGKDLSDKNEKLTLGLVWSLILHYSINALHDDAPAPEVAQPASQPIRKATATDALFQWGTQRTQDYENVDWAKFQPYDLAICALLDSYVPEKINFKSLDPTDHQGNINLAVNVMKDLGIFVFVYPEDVLQAGESGAIDDKILLTQLSAVKAVLENNDANADVQERGGITLDDDASNNSEYEGARFTLTMTLSGSNYNNGAAVNENEHKDGPSRTFSLTLTSSPFINPAGVKLDLCEPNSNDENQKFVFGRGVWTTVIDSIPRQGMVWDVADADNLDPPEGTPFYLFPFHGRHNQHFVYKNGHIIATQNGQCVTYVGGEQPFVMRRQSEKLNERQTFDIHLI